MTIERRNHGRGHSYRIDGTPADGVTTVIDEALPKPALIGWAANTTAAYAVDHWAELADLPPSQRLDVLKRARYADADAAARRGTEVHKLGAALVADIEVAVPDELAGHVDSYVRFLDEWKVRPMLIETTVAHRTYRYCGTLDLVADVPHLGQRLLLDIKTGRSGIYPETAIQLAAYAHAELYLADDGAERPMPELDGAAAVHVRADGYDVVPLDVGPDVFLVFRHLLWLARTMRGAQDWRGEIARVA